MFYVLDGHGSLDDADGATHYFGPGDLVVIPKGHGTGDARWDVLTDLHKIWFVHEHDNIEETTNPIRVQVYHYKQLVSPANHDDNGISKGAIRGTEPRIYSQKLYEVGPTNVGTWMWTPGAFKMDNLDTTISFLVMEGVFFITNDETGECRRCVAGDTVMLPQGWSGTVDVVETSKKLWTTIYS